MKPLFDLLQIALQTPGLGLLVSFVLVVAVLQAWKLIGVLFSVCIAVLKQSKKVVFRFWGVKRAAWLLVLATLVYMFGYQISCALQYLEEAYISPTYIVADSSAWAMQCYESEIKKHTTPAQFQVVRDSTYVLAAELGCDPLSIYEVAQSECGMNPFCIRTDGIAAGWIQFTTNGLGDFGVPLSTVKQWCQSGDAVALMALTGKYMRHWANGRKLQTSGDIYCTVFAPGCLHYSDEQALYAGWSNPAYYMNKGLDGFVIAGDKALYLPYTRDGKLTKKDLTAALAYKKAGLLRKYKN